MSVLQIYEYPHPVLKAKAQKVAKIDENVQMLLNDMLETMYAAGGVGIAAPQVGVSQRIVVIDVEQDEDKKSGNPIFMVNPEIIWRSEETGCREEGCLSVPGQRAEVERNLAVKVKYLDFNGVEKVLEATDLLAVAVQHELDHLDGILYIDHISRLKRNMLLKKLKKMREEKED